ncbi:MAG: 4Fe-4S dicluster domain-containing protein [Candidatus Methanomethylophilaceae archaeon]|nr:4Fe-4S dicluster domain-containing protein [Candidatus Methanomethylophilaceae archaeon]
MDCGDIRETFGLDRCVSCGACTDACPSARHGGIVPDAAVASVIEGESPERIWDCLMCHRCSMVCPQKIDVAEMMALLRGISGGIPERYLRSAAQVYKTGRTTAASKRTASQRESLGLSPADDADADALRQVLDKEGWPNE